MMKNFILLLLSLSLFNSSGVAQQSWHEFDTIQFNRQLELANRFVDCEYFTEQALSTVSNQPDLESLDWFSYKESNSWFTVGGKITNNSFGIRTHLKTDSSGRVTEYAGNYDTSKLIASGLALSQAQKRFQLIRDTSNMYFSTFINQNPDRTISVWYFPAFQPSGQAIFGCEWEYIYDESGKSLLKQDSYLNTVTSVWIGQPRELWLNYRNTVAPTVGSLFFVQSFRDFFTRIRIDTLKSTSMTSKNSEGNYIWSHKMK